MGIGTGSPDLLERGSILIVFGADDSDLRRSEEARSTFEDVGITAR